MERLQKWLQKHGPAIVLTLIAFGIIYVEVRVVPRANRLVPAAVMNPLFAAMGKWAIRFLLISLAVTPIYALTGWRFINKIRKPTGLLTFLFVCIHFGIYLYDITRVRVRYDSDRSLIHYLTEPQYVIFGLIAFVILALMTATSIKPTMRLMGRCWKPLHRLVYVAGIMIMLHSLTAALSSKQGFIEGPGYTHELKLYLGILIAELFLRVPGVMPLLKRILPFAPDGRKSKRKREFVTE